MGAGADRDRDCGGNQSGDRTEPERERVGGLGRDGRVADRAGGEHDAPTWPPTTPPMARTTVFMPAATPISRGSTLSAISAGHRGEGGADAEPEQRAGEQDRAGLGVHEREQERGDADDQHAAARAAISSRSGARPRPRSARRRAWRASSAAGTAPPSWRSPRSRSRAPRSVSTKVGTRMKQLKSAKPEISVAMLVSRIGRCASMCRSTIGELERDSTTPQSAKKIADERHDPDEERRVPAPVLALRQREHQ